MTRAGYKAVLVISLALSLFLAGSGGEIVPQRPDRVDFGDLVPFPDFDRDPRYSPMMAQYEAILRGEGRFWLGGKEIDLYQIMKSPESNITATAVCHCGGIRRRRHGRRRSGGGDPPPDGQR